jgi:hypothetical protein
MKPANVVGTILLFLGLVPFVLWVLDYLDIIRKDADPGHWGIIVMTFFLISIGGMLIAGKGHSVQEAFMSWFKRQG